MSFSIFSNIYFVETSQSARANRKCQHHVENELFISSVFLCFIDNEGQFYHLLWCLNALNWHKKIQGFKIWSSNSENRQRESPTKIKLLQVSFGVPTDNQVSTERFNREHSPLKVLGSWKYCEALLMANWWTTSPQVCWSWFLSSFMSSF